MCKNYLSFEYWYNVELLLLLLEFNFRQTAKLVKYCKLFRQMRPIRDIQHLEKEVLLYIIFSTCSVEVFTLHAFFYLILTVSLKDGIILSVLMIRKLRVRKIKLYAEKHIANKLHNWDSKQGLIPELRFLSILSYCFSVTTLFQSTSVFPTDLKLPFPALIHILEKQF